jgi:hypothetical protein
MIYVDYPNAGGCANFRQAERVWLQFAPEELLRLSISGTQTGHS